MAVRSPWTFGQVGAAFIRQVSSKRFLFIGLYFYNSSGSTDNRVPLLPFIRMNCPETGCSWSSLITWSTFLKVRNPFPVRQKCSPTSQVFVRPLFFKNLIILRCSLSLSGPSSRMSPNMSILCSDSICRKLFRAAIMLVGLAL